MRVVVPAVDVVCTQLVRMVVLNSYVSVAASVEGPHENGVVARRVQFPTTSPLQVVLAVKQPC